MQRTGGRIAGHVCAGDRGMVTRIGGLRELTAAEPRVIQGLWGDHPLVRIPLETSTEEIYECLIFAPFEGRFPLPGPWGSANLTPPRSASGQMGCAIRHLDHCAISGQALGADERLGSFPILDQLQRGHAQELDHQCQLIPLIFARKEGISGEQLREDASQTPHVNGHPVAAPQDDLGSTVESGLDVRVDPLVLLATRSEIDHLDPGSTRLLQQHVFWLQITVD